MYSYSLWTSLITIGQSIFSYASPLVIGAFMPVAAVGRYALAVAACTHLESVIRPVDQVFFPLLTQLHATGQHATLRKVYVAGSRISFVIASSLAVGAGLWADDFFRFWIGAKYVAQGGEFTPVPLLFQLLLIGLLGRMMSCFGGQVLLASLRVRTIGVLSFCDAMSSLALALILVPRHGLIGMVIASVVPIFVFRVAAAQIIVGTLMRVSIAEFLWQVIGRSTLAGVAIACDVRLVQYLLPAQSLKEVVAYGLLSACFAAPITIFVGLNSDERIRFVVNPFLKLMTRLSGAAALPTTSDVAAATRHAEERN
jgi:O-antigen/teichoic acid export membrane protein